jgi:hypothetical protein
MPAQTSTRRRSKSSRNRQARRPAGGAGSRMPASPIVARQSARKFRQRQRTTLSAFGSGPASTRPRSSLIWASLNLSAAPGACACQTVNADLVVTMYPITQGLRRVIALRRQSALRWQVIPAGDLDGSAHPILQCSESPRRTQRIVLRAVWEPGERRVQRRLLGWTAQRHLVPKLSCHTPTKGRPHEV